VLNTLPSNHQQQQQKQQQSQSISAAASSNSKSNSNGGVFQLQQVCRSVHHAPPSYSAG
jgi:hypothetical protein